MANDKGFSIVEFIVGMSLLLLIFAAAFSIFVPVARRSKVEGGSVETQIEGVIGLELLRKDIVHAGAGLPWVLNGANFQEAAADPDGFNDDVPAGTDNPPRPLILKNAITTAGLGMNNSDYLVIKSQLVATPITPDGTNYQDNPAAEKWSYVNPDGTTRVWNSADDDLATTDRVIVVQPVAGTAAMVLAVDTSAGNKFWTTYAASMPTAYRPTGTAASYVFGIDSATNPRMPFNRADYYLSKNNVPSKCLPGTGVLVKRVLRQDIGQFGKELPLLDCVADFQVVFGLDNTFGDNSPQRNCLTNDPAPVTINGMPAFSATFTPADAERATMREVRIYILVQEGTFDMEYNFTNYSTGTSILVGENDPNDCDAPGTPPANQSCNCPGATADATLGQLFDMTTLPPDPDTSRNWTYNKFRWRVYKMVVKPEGIVRVE